MDATSPPSQESASTEAITLPLSMWGAGALDLDDWAASAPADDLEDLMMTLFKDEGPLLAQPQEDAGSCKGTPSAVSQTDTTYRTYFPGDELVVLSETDEPAASSDDTSPSESTTQPPIISSCNDVPLRAERNTSTTVCSAMSAAEDSDDEGRSSLFSSNSQQCVPVSLLSSSSMDTPPPPEQQQQQQQQHFVETSSTRSVSPLTLPRNDSCNSSSAPAPGPTSDLSSHIGTGSESKRSAVPWGTGVPSRPVSLAPAGSVGYGGTGMNIPITAVPNFGGLMFGGGFPGALLAAGSEAAGNEAFAVGSKRMRGGESKFGRQARNIAGASPQSSVRGDENPESGNGRADKRRKNEERLRKNREAAERSRIKQKDVRRELENRAETLSKNLVKSREKIDALEERVTALREENTFLRGMLSAAGFAANLLPCVSEPASARGSTSANSGGGDMAAVAAAAAGANLHANANVRANANASANANANANASASPGASPSTNANANATTVGAVCSSLVTALSCIVAVSAVGIRSTGGGGAEGGGGSARAIAGNRRMGGRRTLLSIEEHDYPLDDESTVGFGAGVRQVLESDVLQRTGGAIAIMVGLVMLILGARWAYTALARRAGRGGGGAVGCKGGWDGFYRALRQSRSDSSDGEIYNLM